MHVYQAFNKYKNSTLEDSVDCSHLIALILCFYFQACIKVYGGRQVPVARIHIFPFTLTCVNNMYDPLFLQSGLSNLLSNNSKL